MEKEVIIPADLGGVPLSSEELAAIPDFSAIRKETWDKFPGAVARKEYRAGEILMREGESGTTAFYILSGSVEIYIAASIASATPKRRVERGFFSTVARIGDYLTGTRPGPPRAGRRVPTSLSTPQ